MSIPALIDAIARQAPDPGRERAVALQAGDALACLALARASEDGRHLADFYGSGRPAAAWEKAAGAAAIIRMSEGDSIHIPSCLTPAAIVVPVALATARNPGCLFPAIQAGVAVGLWIAQSVGGVRALERGVWPTLLAAPAMAAATASVAMELDAERVEHAVALAVSGSSGRLGRPAGTPSGRWLAIGEATARGLRAAEAAEHGFRADTALPDRPWLEAQNGGEIAACEPDPDAVMKIGLKPFIAARQGMNALVAFASIRSAFQAADIEQVEVDLPAECLPVVTRPLVEKDRLSRVANLAFRMATAALDADSLLDPSGLPADRDAAQAIAARVSIRAAEMPAAAASWPAAVRVRAAGRWHEADCARCPGDAGDMEAQAGIVMAKLRRVPENLREMLETLVAADRPATVLTAGTEALRHILEPLRASMPPRAPLGVPCPAD